MGGNWEVRLTGRQVNWEVRLNFVAFTSITESFKYC